MVLWVLAAAIPACFVTFIVAGAALAIQARTPGDERRKLRAAGGFVAGASLLLLLLLVAAYWQKRQENADDLKIEKVRVEDFVRSSAEVRASVGDQLTVSIASIFYGDSEPLPVHYDVAVTGTKTIFAIVEINRQQGQPHFILKCTTPLHSGQRDPHKSPCAQ